jgi:N-carbamoyl-L-amino-acid hydrolase
MLFVRNPTGVSHAPEEHAEPADCLAGVEALAAVLQELACDENDENDEK